LVATRGRAGGPAAPHRGSWAIPPSTGWRSKSWMAPPSLRARVF